MKYLILAAALLSQIIAPLPKDDQPATENETNFKVEIEQNGEILAEKEGIITLKKALFKFKLTFNGPTDLFVSASWGRYYFDYPDESNIFECNDNSLEGCRFVSIKTGNEEKFNTSKDIYVGNEDYHFVWFYDPEIDWYRMDEGVKIENGVIYAEVTVENIFDLDKRDDRNYQEADYNYKIEDIDQDIYMVFATSHYETGMEHPAELQREKFILKFE